MRFGYGSALSVLIFFGSLIFALLYIRTLGLHPEGGEKV
jgi:ABC-type sugar transport system permease subunit